MIEGIVSNRFHVVADVFHSVYVMECGFCIGFSREIYSFKKETGHYLADTLLNEGWSKVGSLLACNHCTMKYKIKKPG